MKLIELIKSIEMIKSMKLIKLKKLRLFIFNSIHIEGQRTNFFSFNCFSTGALLEKGGLQVACIKFVVPS